MHRSICLAVAIAVTTACQQPLRGETFDERWEPIGSAKTHHFKSTPDLLNDRAVDPKQLIQKSSITEGAPRKRSMRTISGVLPPREFDRPYPLDNLLIVERYASEAEVRLAGCRKSKPPLSGYLACSWANLASWSEERKMLVSGCRIIMASDAILIAHGLEPVSTYRHEIGHCNGWRGDHAGARDYHYEVRR
jgi:hypothetical protein